MVDSGHFISQGFNQINFIIKSRVGDKTEVPIKADGFLKQFRMLSLHLIFDLIS